MTKQGGHRIKHQDAEQAAQTVPEFGFGFQAVPQAAKALATALLNLLHQKRQQHEQGQHRRQLRLPMPVVVLEMIALVLQGLEGLVLDLPAAAPGTPDAFDRPRGKRQIRHPGPTLHDAVWRGLFGEQKVDPDVRGTLAQAQFVRPGIVMLPARRIRLAELFEVATCLPSGELFEQARVRVGLDGEHRLPAVAADLAHMRRVGIERLLDQQNVQVVVAQVQISAEPFGGIALTIVFLRAVLPQHRLEIERGNFSLGRVDQNCRQPRVVIRDYSVAVRARQATGTMHFVRIEMLYAVERDDDEPAPILVLADDACPTSALKTGVQERTPMNRIKRVQDAAHLVVAGDSPVDVVDAAQIARLGHALLFEVGQRRGLERKHGESAFQDIRQCVAGMVRECLKFAVQPAHQFVKVQILLKLQVTFCHAAKLQQEYSISKLRIADRPNT